MSEPPKKKGKPYWYPTIYHPKSSGLFPWCVFPCVTLHVNPLNCAVLEGIELIFFITATIGLCFGFVLGTDILFIAEQPLHSIKDFSAFIPIPPQSRLGVCKELEGSRDGTNDITPYDVLVSI